MARHTTYDYIIAGGGCAGLSLVYHMLQTDLRHKRILIIEKEDKNRNDRTWCFWEKNTNPFEHLLFHRWQHMHFYGRNFGKKLDLSPYTYKMLRSIDFYAHVNQCMAESPRVDRLQATVEDIQSNQHQVAVHAAGQVYTADWVFSSIRRPDEQKQAGRHHYLLQHFKGWVVKTEQAFFNPEEAVLMDFRIAQEGDCRFVYVLPTDAHTALVEYTIFSKDLLAAETYDAALQQYIREYLGLAEYTVTHEEFGVIPMTDMPYEQQPQTRVINIGTAGGITKPSTGYTFLRIQQDTQALVHALLTSASPCRRQSAWQRRFGLYDGALLHVLAQKLHPADSVFTHLFKNNPAQRVFKFLDEDTNLLEEVLVANSVPRFPFIRGIVHAASH